MWLTWISIPALAIGIGLLQRWWFGIIVLLVGVIAQILYIKVFPHISRLLGYGSVEDVMVENTPETKTISRVTLYTANFCPFCSIVKQRLIELQYRMGFELEEVDITFRLGHIRSKGPRSVPAIEKGERYLIGNATSAQLVEFLTKGSSNNIGTYGQQTHHYNLEK